MAEAELLGMFIYHCDLITPGRGRYVSFSAVRCTLLVLDAPLSVLYADDPGKRRKITRAEHPFKLGHAHVVRQVSGRGFCLADREAHEFHSLPVIEAPAPLVVVVNRGLPAAPLSVLYADDPGKTIPERATRGDHPFMSAHTYKARQVSGRGR